MKEASTEMQSNSSKLPNGGAIIVGASILLGSLIIAFLVAGNRGSINVQPPKIVMPTQGLVASASPTQISVTITNAPAATEGSTGKDAEYLGVKELTDRVVGFLAEEKKAERERAEIERKESDQKALKDYELQQTKFAEEKRDAMTALFAINHINWVVTKIKTFNDSAVLEEEYKGLTADALNLRVIKDPELINLICRILDVIVEMRIEEKERAFLKDELDQGASDALADAVSGIRITGLNPVAMVASAVTSVASAALNYKKAKRALQKKFEKQNWSLDKNRMYYLNDLNKELLRDFWMIVQRYKELPEEYLVSEKNIQLLVDHLKDEDAKKRFDFLRAFDGQFSGFQPYWYHRAAAGYEVAGDKKLSDETRAEAREDARTSLEKYMAIQIECGNILRKDATAAKAALLQAAMLSEDGSKDTQAYQTAIDVIIRNTAADDWQSAYFCALIAVRELNDISQAEKILAPAIAELDWQRRRRLSDWKGELEAKNASSGKVKVGGLLTTGDALYECSTLIANTAKLSPDDYQNKLAKICEDQNASVREKMFWYGAMGYKQALEKLRPDVSRMLVHKRNGHYIVSVPFSWVIARGAEMALRINDSDRKEEGERSMEERDDGNQYALIDYGPITESENYICFRSRFDRNDGKDENGRQKNVCYMVEVSFEFDGLKFKPSRATFGQWIKGGATTRSHWQMTQPPLAAQEGAEIAQPRPDVETIDFKEESK